MPTSARLFAAVAFAVLGFFAAEIFKPAMPDGTQFGHFSGLVAGIGLVCGWMIMGGLAGHGMVNAAGYGVRTAVTIAFWALLLFNIEEMIIRSTNMIYDGPLEAVLAVFDLMLERGKLMLNAEVLGTLLIGGMLGGILSEWADRRWR